MRETHHSAPLVFTAAVLEHAGLRVTETQIAGIIQNSTGLAHVSRSLMDTGVRAGWIQESIGVTKSCISHAIPKQR